MIVCAGGGVLGTRAAISASDTGGTVLVIDPDPHCGASMQASRIVTSLREGIGEGITHLIADAVDVLEDVLIDLDVERVVPASPGHLFAHLLVRGGLSPVPTGRVDWRDVVLWDEDTGTVLLSRMHDGRCLDDCRQPDVCPVTGSSSPPMWETAQALGERLAPSCVVLRTRYLGGVGAIRADDLLDGLEQASGVEGRVAVATSCRCHAILNVMGR